MSLDAAEKARVHEALERAHGNRSLAASYLGITSTQLKEALHSCGELNTIWGYGPAPAALTDVDTISRGKVRENIPTEAEGDYDIINKLISEDVKLSKGLTELKLEPSEIEIGRSLFKFNQQHFFKSMDIIGGGVTRAHLKLQTQLDELAKRLDEVRTLIRAGRSTTGKHLASSSEEADATGMAITIYDDLRSTLVREEKALMDSFIAITNVMRQMLIAQSDVNQLIATIRLTLMGKGGFKEGKIKRIKPGFVPQDVEELKQPAGNGGFEHEPAA